MTARIACWAIVEGTAKGARQVDRSSHPIGTGKALPELENKRFDAIADSKCDSRANFRGMWGNVRLRRDTSI
jgi:hypothetical protein